MSETVIHFCYMRSDCGDNYNYFDVLWIFDDRFAEDALADGQINRYKDELFACVWNKEWTVNLNSLQASLDKRLYSKADDKISHGMFIHSLLALLIK